jgi:hypothetical protein
MSTDVTMNELELETAELLPSRETLCYNPCSGLSLGLDVNICVSLCL